MSRRGESDRRAPFDWSPGRLPVLCLGDRRSESDGPKEIPTICPRRKDSTGAERRLSAPELSALTKLLQKRLYPARSEEDLRIGMEFVIRDALPGLPPASYEKSVRTSTFRGRADAVHQALVIEYERPGSMRSAPKSDEAVQQVCDYLTTLRLGEHEQAEMVRESDSGPERTTLSPEDEERLSGGV